MSLNGINGIFFICTTNLIKISSFDPLIGRGSKQLIVIRLVWEKFWYFSSASKSENIKEIKELKYWKFGFNDRKSDCLFLIFPFEYFILIGNHHNRWRVCLKSIWIIYTQYIYYPYVFFLNRFVNHKYTCVHCKISVLFIEANMFRIKLNNHNFSYLGLKTSRGLWSRLQLSWSHMPPPPSSVFRYIYATL